jgi:Fe-S-cluster containining protein
MSAVTRLRALSVAATAPRMNGSATACAVCNAKCCLEYTVTVTGRDIWEISSKLGIAPEDFVACYTSLRDTPGLFRLDHGDRRFDLALDKVAAAEPSAPAASRPCVFLLEAGGVRRCGIHAHRPYVCQTYPAYLDDGVVVVREDVLCPSGGWKLTHMDVGSWKRRLDTFQLEIDLYRDVVEVWNQRVLGSAPGRVFSPLEFFAYLLNVYGAMEPVRAALGDLGELAAQWSKCRAEQGGRLRDVSGSALLSKARVGFDQILDRFRPPASSDRAPGAVAEVTSERLVAGSH